MTLHHLRNLARYLHLKVLLPLPRLQPKPLLWLAQLPLRRQPLLRPRVLQLQLVRLPVQQVQRHRVRPAQALALVPAPLEALPVVQLEVQLVADQPAVAEETLVVQTLAAAKLVASQRAPTALMAIQTVRVMETETALLMKSKLHKTT
jgi:hypothetical protein